MNIVHFTNNVTDGAGKAVMRLHEALLKMGITSKVLTCYDNDDSNRVYGIFKSKNDLFFPRLKKKIFDIIWKPKTLFDYNIQYATLNDVKPYIEDVDVICFYSIQRFINTDLMKDMYDYSKKPVVWSIFDMGPITGGCHFNSGCQKYTETCGDCIQLTSSNSKDISYKLLIKKKNDLNDMPITFVAASSWARRQISNSRISKNKDIVDIMLSVGDEVFYPDDTISARKKLGLDPRNKIAVFGCFNLNDKRKGGNYFKEALRVLKSNPENKELLKDLLIVTFGELSDFTLDDIGVKWRHLGLISDENHIADIYRASNLMISPSIDDLGPMMVIEAYMCKIPIVSFNRGVAADLINNSNGYLAHSHDAVDLAKGIKECLLSNKCPGSESNAEKANMCRSGYQADRYKELFKNIMALT